MIPQPSNCLQLTEDGTSHAISVQDTTTSGFVASVKILRVSYL
jgi:hypothetical protein